MNVRKTIIAVALREGARGLKLQGKVAFLYIQQ